MPFSHTWVHAPQDGTSSSYFNFCVFQNFASEAQLQPPGSITSHKPGDPTFTLVSVWAFLEFLSELLVIKNLSQCVYWKNSKDNLWSMGQLKQNAKAKEK